MRKEDTILVIDMQKVYQPGNPWACAHVNEAAQQIETLLDHVLELRDAPSVLLTRYIAPADEDAQGVWADYNRENRAINENPVMNEFIPAIARYVEEFPYIDKCTYSCFSNEYVHVAADRSMVHGGRVILTGVVAECCVLSTMMEAIDQGHSVIFLYDCISGQSQENEQAIRKLAESFAPLHTLVMSSEEYIR